MPNTNHKPLISICIPTFNRCDKVYNLVSSILQYPGDDIHVAVLDNRSTDNTAILLSQINDERFVFAQNDQNIGGPLNHVKALTLAKGTYAFFCLDKDYLDHNKIAGLIKKIRARTDVVFGHCTLDIDTETEDLLYNEGFESVKNMSYLSQHPTGIFYRSDLYAELNTVQRILAAGEQFPFFPDLIRAEIAMLGKSVIFNYPAFYTETAEECRTIPSFTYNAENAFFMPVQRQFVFDAYVDSVEKLNLSKVETKSIIAQLYIRTLNASTFAFKDVLGNNDICEHHGIAVRKVGIKEIWKLHNNFSAHFLKKKTLIGRAAKLRMVWYGHILVLAKIILFK